MHHIVSRSESHKVDVWKVIPSFLKDMGTEQEAVLVAAVVPVVGWNRSAGVWH